MKILQINIFYNEGSTGRIVADIHQRLLRDGHESYVVFGRGKDWQLEEPTHLYRTTPGTRSELYRKISRITGLRYNTAYFETLKLVKYIGRIKPDIVHLHCLNCAYIQPFILLKYLGIKNYPVLVTHHADVTITANCDHAFECERWKTGCGKCSTFKLEKRSFFIDASHRSWIQMNNAFKLVKQLYASGVSDWMSNRVKQSPFFIQRECRTILNGIDINSFKYLNNFKKLRKNLGIGQDEKIVLHVTPNFSAPIKGGAYVKELAIRMPKIKFIVVGINPSEARELPNNIIPVFRTESKEQLAEYYSMANVTILTSYRESFSMVTAESLCCGTPVVGFKAGAPETIAIPEYSEFVEYGNIDALEYSIKKMLEQSLDKPEISKNAQQKYDADEMFNNYLRYYKVIINNSKSS